MRARFGCVALQLNKPACASVLETLGRPLEPIGRRRDIKNIFLMPPGQFARHISSLGLLSKQRVFIVVCALFRADSPTDVRSKMSKFALLAAFAAGASVAALTAAPVDTLKSARIRAKARLREALAVDDKVSNPDAMTSVKITTAAPQSIDHRRDVGRSRNCCEL